MELLAAITVAGVSLTAATTFYASQARNMREVSYRVEAQQALRGSLDAIARDVRLAGACLPTNGQFVSLSGTNAATDSITVTTGVVRDDLSCLYTSMTADGNAGATNLQVNSSDGFSADMLAYVRDPNGGGQIARIASVGTGVITLETALGGFFPGCATGVTGCYASTVYGIDERKYEVDNALSYARLMLTINRGTPQPFAAGMIDFQVQYLLNRNCPACDIVDLPSDTATWSLVNEVLLTTSVETIGAVTNRTFTESSRAKPRNLLQG